MTDGPDAPDGTVVTPMEFDEVDPREGMELLDGTVVVGKLIARGGMGAVYRAKHVKRNMDVAVKFLDVRSLNVDIAELERRFAAEIQVLEGLKSIHVLRVIDFGHTSDGDAFMVTELLEGGTLEAEIKASGGLTEARTIEVLRETSRALVEAHALGIIHRDIKPANLFVEEVPGGLKQTRVLDFGVARVVRDGESRTAVADDGSVPMIGTYRFMSPEQASLRPAVDKSDVYSLGIVAYACLSGAPPFIGPPELIVDAHKNVIPQPLDAAISLELRVLVTRMLAKDPESRPSALEVLQALDGMAESRPPPPPPPTPEPPPKPTSRWGWLAVALVVVIGGFGVGRIVGSDDDPAPIRDGGLPIPPPPPRDAGTPDAGAKTGIARFELVPPSAEVVIGDDPAPNASDGVELAPGEHTAFVSAPKHRAKPVAFTVVAGKTITVPVRLDRVGGGVPPRVTGPAPAGAAKPHASVVRAAQKCYAKHGGGGSVAFTVTSAPGLAPVVISDNTAFANCVKGATKQVRYPGDVFVPMNVAPR